MKLCLNSGKPGGFDHEGQNFDRSAETAEQRANQKTWGQWDIYPVRLSALGANVATRSATARPVAKSIPAAC